MHLLTQFAYLDPSTGGLFIQSLIGVVAGIGVFGRRLIASFAHRIKSFFGSKKD